ncbi:MAG: hypothetical protein RLZZ117_2303 [Cyanobacteriota bacterium]|jgi:hypothetical protein
MQLRRGEEARGEKLVLYSCRHGYAAGPTRSVICRPRWWPFAKAEQRLGQGLCAQSSAA